MRVQAKSRLLLTLLIFSSASCVIGQQLEPRAYSPSPVGTSFLVTGFARSSGGVTFDPTIPVTDVNAKLNSSFLAIGRTFGLFGRQSLVTAALPYVWGEVSGSIGEQRRSITRSGLADINLRFAINIVGSPALNPTQFAAARHDNFILAASLSVSPPTGQYDPVKLINLGTNRWAFRPEIGFSLPIKKMSLDLYAAASFFTANNNFFPGQSVRAQDALGSLQGHLSYSVRRGLWIAFDSTWYGGGATHLNNGPATSRQSSSRIGGTVSFPIGKVQSIKISYSSGVTARIGSAFDTLAVSWQIIRFDHHPAPAQQMAPALTGVYRGTLPCADCQGIDTTLTLYAKSPQEFVNTSYLLQQTYRGTRDGDRTLAERGTWFLLKGNAANPDAIILQLRSINGGIQNYLRVNQDELKLLDREQREIASPFNLSLRRTDQSRPR